MLEECRKNNCTDILQDKERETVRKGGRQGKRSRMEEGGGKKETDRKEGRKKVRIEKGRKGGKKEGGRKRRREEGREKGGKN